MNKYIVTALVDGIETPFTVRAKDIAQVRNQIARTTSINHILRIETKEDFKKRNKPFDRVMTNGYMRVKSSKTGIREF